VNCIIRDLRRSRRDSARSALSAACAADSPPAASPTRRSDACRSWPKRCRKKPPHSKSCAASDRPAQRRRRRRAWAAWRRRHHAPHRRPTRHRPPCRRRARLPDRILAPDGKCRRRATGPSADRRSWGIDSPVGRGRRLGEVQLGQRRRCRKSDGARVCRRWCWWGKT